MKTYELTCPEVLDELYAASGVPTVIKVSGDDVLSAIESKFRDTARFWHVGNYAGYTLLRVWLDYDAGLFDGEGGGLLHILWQGSASQIGYDAPADDPKERLIRVRGVSRDEFPDSGTLEFELKDGKEFNPFTFCEDDKEFHAWYAYGVALSIINELALRHCATKRGGKADGYMSLTDVMFQRYRSVFCNDAIRFLDMAFAEIINMCPNSDAATKKLMDRLVDLMAKIREKAADDGSKGLISLGYHKARHYFRTAGKITALAYYRNLRGKTQQQVADEVGMSVRQLQYYENPRETSLGDAKFSVVKKLAKVLDVAPDKLVNDFGAVFVQEHGDPDDED